MEREEPHSCADGRCGQDVTEEERERIEREKERQTMSLVDGRERIRKEDRMSEESVMRSLNTDAGLGRYIAGKGETKKTGSRRTGEKEGKVQEKDEMERLNELDGKGFLNSEGISNRAIPPSIRFLRREILKFQTSLAKDRVS